MKAYLDLGRKIMTEGDEALGRADSRTRSLFGEQLKFDLMKGFPIPTTQRVALQPLVAELLWFLSGSTNNADLLAMGCNYWTNWALKDSVTVQRPRSGYDRATDYAILMGRPVHEVIDLFNSVGLDKAEKLLKDHNIAEYSDEVAVLAGELGPIYGAQWRNFGGVDQIKKLLNDIRDLPASRRHIVTGWNPTVLPDETKSHDKNIGNGKAVLPPCHTLWQVYIRPATKSQLLAYVDYYADLRYRDDRLVLESVDIDMLRADLEDLDERDFDTLSNFANEYGLPTQRLSLQLYARSQDFPIGTVVNIPSYALLTHILAASINAIPGDYIHTMGDVHVYADQFEKFEEQLQREPYPLPKLVLEESWRTFNAGALPHTRNPAEFEVSGRGMDSITLVDYISHPRITYKITV